MRTLQFTALCLPLTSLLLLAGCGTPDPTGDDEASESGTDGTATETDAGTEIGTDDNGTTTTTTDDNGTTTEDEAETSLDTTDTTEETTDETTDTTDATDTTETTDGGACPADPGDDECTACVKDNCCDELTTCLANDDCACLTECIQGGGNQFECFQMCGVMGIPPGAAELGGCTMQSCGMVCGL